MVKSSSKCNFIKLFIELSFVDDKIKEELRILNGDELDQGTLLCDVTKDDKTDIEYDQHLLSPIIHLKSFPLIQIEIQMSLLL